MFFPLDIDKKKGYDLPHGIFGSCLSSLRKRNFFCQSYNDVKIKYNN